MHFNQLKLIGLKVERLQDEIKNNPSVNGGIMKRQHPGELCLLLTILYISNVINA